MKKLIFDHGYKYEATFLPKNLSDLKSELKETIGKKVNLRFAWIAEKYEKFSNQPIFVEDDERRKLKGYWVPLEDVSDIQLSNQKGVSKRK